jgi:MFS transporter, DHA1 family, multidrug resistance protein
VLTEPAPSQATAATARNPAPFMMLVALSAASPFAMNAMLPALPQITASFNTSYAIAQLALTLSLMSFGAAQLVLGPLADRYGRRPVMLAGFSLFVAGSLATALAPGIWWMIAGRILQSAGGAAGLVLSRTIAHDIHGRAKAASAIGYLTMAMALSQMSAPWFGGVVQEKLNWHAIFWALAAAGGVLLAWTAMRLDETKPASTGGGSLAATLTAAGGLMHNPAFLAAAGNMAFTGGTFFAFIGTAPHVVQDLYGRSASEYGLWCILPALGYSIGNFVSGRMAERWGGFAMVRAGMALGCVGIVALWVMSNGLTIPSTMAMAMDAAPTYAGSAAGVAGALQMLVAAFVGMLSATLSTASALPMIAVMTVSFLLALFCLWGIRRSPR